MPILDRFTLGRLNSGLHSARAEQAIATRDAASTSADTFRPSQDTETAAARVCGALDCGNGWVRPWKNRRRPVFEGEWACSSRCLQMLVRAAVRRVVGDGVPTDSAWPHRHRVPLGLVLLAQGWITHPQLQAALEAQRASGQGRIGDWLVKSCGLPEERVTRGLGVQWNCPVLAINGFSPTEMALVMPKRFVVEFGMVPLRVAGSSLLYVAFGDRMNAAASLALEQMTGMKVESGLLSSADYEQAKRNLLKAQSVPVIVEEVEDADALTHSIVKRLEARQPLASRIVRMHGYFWLRMWLESGAIPRGKSSPQTAEDTEDLIYTLPGALTA